MEEPWEALDLDDSDISSSSSSLSLLRRCTLQRPQQPSHHDSLSPPPQPPPVSRSSPIPGPAAAIQAAMHRKSHSTLRNAEASEISTQEYIRRVEENNGEDFSRNPWVFALDFLHCEGGFDATPLRDIKQRVGAERIDKVVAIVKSCKPNGLGDLMVTLKDSTDTVSASVHRNVLSVGESGKFIDVGSVLILQKVVAFYSSYASCYLNITRNNVVKVISADCAVQSFPEESAKLMSAFEKDLESLERTPSLTHRTDRRSEAQFRDVQPGNVSIEKTAAEELMLRENSSQTISLISSRQIENAANRIPKEPIRLDSADCGVKSVGCLSNLKDGSFRSIQPGPDILAGNHRDFENAEKRRQVRVVSSAPNVIENLDSQHPWQANGAKLLSLLRGKSCTQRTAENLNVQVESPAGTSLTTTKDLEDLDISEGDDIQKQRLHGVSSFSTMVENQASQEIHRTNDSQKGQPTYTVPNARLALVSGTLVQEWTDEQLGILDMDED